MLLIRWKEGGSFRFNFFIAFCKQIDYGVYMNKKTKTLTLSVRIKPEERDRFDELTELLGKQLGTAVSRAQAFNVAIKEAIERRKNNV